MPPKRICQNCKFCFVESKEIRRFRCINRDSQRYYTWDTEKCSKHVFRAGALGKVDDLPVRVCANCTMMVKKRGMFFCSSPFHQVELDDTCMRHCDEIPL